MSPRIVSAPKVAVSASTPPRRQRLDPAERAAQILDFAGVRILEGGLTEISMEQLGRDAGVSKALIYNYFPNLNDLLRALLEREIAQLREKSITEIAAATNFRDMIYRTTRMYVQHVSVKGPLLQRLWKEPSVARAVAEKNQTTQNEALRYLVKQVRKEYNLPLDVAIAAVDMQMAMTEAAAQHLFNARNDVDFATDVCVNLLLGGLDSLARIYKEKQTLGKSAVKKNAKSK